MKFSIKTKKGKSRVGVLETSHGTIETPNLAIVGTHGKLKALSKTDYKKATMELMISNTFHLWVKGTVRDIKKAGGIHKWNGIKVPIMTDSGGFQVFSLGWGKVHGVGKVAPEAVVCPRKDDPCLESAPQSFAAGQGIGKALLKTNPVEITDDGVTFKYDGRKFTLTPEKSMKIQWDIGADMIFAFDECTSPLHSHAYNLKSLKKTHAWAKRSLEAHQKLRKKNGMLDCEKSVFPPSACVSCWTPASLAPSRSERVPKQTFRNPKTQALFGIVQGGIFEDLRKKSSKFIGSLPFDGFGVGGSFGEKEMGEVLGWALSGLPEDKPRHLLGIGKICDIFEGVKNGIDLFDCVIPTREARHGALYTMKGKIDIKRGYFREDNSLIEKNCKCVACASGVTKAKPRALLKGNKRENLQAQRLAIMHNIYFYKNLFRKIRAGLQGKKGLDGVKKEYGAYFK